MLVDAQYYCDIKIHKVEEKWERRRKREAEEAERQRKEAQPIPVKDWPVRVPEKKPANEQPNATPA